MCSGCAGDYPGDFEDSDESPAGSVENGAAAWRGGGPGPVESRLSAEGAASFEAKPNWEARSEARSKLAGHPHSKFEGAGEGGDGEDCEILVSETQIVEIRVIRAHCEETGECWGEQAGGNARAR